MLGCTEIEVYFSKTDNVFFIQRKEMVILKQSAWQIKGLAFKDGVAAPVMYCGKHNFMP